MFKQNKYHYFCTPRKQSVQGHKAEHSGRPGAFLYLLLQFLIDVWFNSVISWFYSVISSGEKNLGDLILIHSFIEDLALSLFNLYTNSLIKKLSQPDFHQPWIFHVGCVQMICVNHFKNSNWLQISTQIIPLCKTLPENQSRRLW